MRILGTGLLSILLISCSGSKQPEQAKEIASITKDSTIRSQIATRLAHHDSASCKIHLHPEIIDVHYQQADLIFVEVAQVDSFLTANAIQKNVGVVIDKEVKVDRMMALMEVFNKKKIDVSLLTKVE